MTIKKAELREALEAIANSFEGADISGDVKTFASDCRPNDIIAYRALKLACAVLQWQIGEDAYGNIKLVRSDLIETEKEPAIDDAF